MALFFECTEVGIQLQCKGYVGGKGAGRNGRERYFPEIRCIWFALQSNQWFLTYKLPPNNWLLTTQFSSADFFTQTVLLLNIKRVSLFHCSPQGRVIELSKKANIDLASTPEQLRSVGRTWNSWTGYRWPHPLRTLKQKTISLQETPIMGVNYKLHLTHCQGSVVAKKLQECNQWKPYQIHCFQSFQ